MSYFKAFREGLGCWFYVIICAIIIFFPKFTYISIPVFCIISLLVNFIQYMRHDRPHLKNNFKLTKEEQKKYIYYLDTAYEGYEKLRECDNIIESKGLRRNADGRLSQRSYAGKDTQKIIDAANKKIDLANEGCTFYANLPTIRYERARKRFSGIFALLFALFAFGIIFTTSPNVESIIGLDVFDALLHIGIMSAIGFFVPYGIFTIVFKKPK